MRPSHSFYLVVATTLLLGCGTPPPASLMPDARAAMARLHATQDCGIGLHANAKIDHFGASGRVRGDLLFFAQWPARLRMDVVGPMNVGVVATLTASDNAFAMADLRNRRFLKGPATACNIARLTTVPVPGHVLVSLLRGDAPILRHEPKAAGIVWSTGGYYVVTIAGTRDAEEVLHLAPHPDDFGRPWQEQRLRVREVTVRQQGILLYRAELDDHRASAMATPQIDPDGIDAPIPTSGPMCRAELPRTIHVEVPGRRADVLFRYEDVVWNPPVTPSTFTQEPAVGLAIDTVTCED